MPRSIPCEGNFRRACPHRAAAILLLAAVAAARAAAGPLHQEPGAGPAGIVAAPDHHLHPLADGIWTVRLGVPEATAQSDTASFVAT